MKHILSLGFVLMMSACGDPSCHPATSEDVRSTIYYRQDPKTGLCFAMRGNIGQPGFAFTNVPCDQVKDQISVMAR